MKYIFLNGTFFPPFVSLYGLLTLSPHRFPFLLISRLKMESPFFPFLFPSLVIDGTKFSSDHFYIRISSFSPRTFSFFCCPFILLNFPSHLEPFSAVPKPTRKPGLLVFRLSYSVDFFLFQRFHSLFLLVTDSCACRGLV